MKQRKQRYFVINRNTRLDNEFNNFIQYKRLTKSSIKYLHNSRFKADRVFKLKEDATPEQLIKILQINPELLEYFV